MKVSVIVTTKNEENNIGNCLESVKSQTYDDIDIIVVDNNSTDKTKKIAHKYTDKVFDKGPERSAQRNFGVSKASGDWILYLDADMILHPEVVSECVSKVQDDVVGLYIPERIVSRPVTDFSKPVSQYQDSFWIKVRDFERSFYDGTVIDAVRFVSKEIFQKVGGFDEKMTGPEDWDFDKKIRQQGRTEVVDSELFHNEGDFDMKTYLSKKKYYSQDMDVYVDKWGRDDDDIKKQLSPFYRYLSVFATNGKISNLVFNPVFAAAMYYLRFRVGFVFVLK